MGKKVELQFQEDNPRSMWQSVRTMTGYKLTGPSLSSADASLASEPNNFYACYEAISSQQAKTAEAEINGWVCEPLTPITLSDIRRVFKHVNTKKTAGPDGISGRILKLVPVVTMTFNLSLTQSVRPTCFKKSTIIPVPKKTRPACLND